MLNAQNRDKNTPLLCAVKESVGRSETPLAVLLGLKADPNTRIATDSLLTEFGKLKSRLDSKGNPRTYAADANKLAELNPLYCHMRRRKPDSIANCILLLDFKAEVFSETIDSCLIRIDQFLVQHLPYLLEQLYYNRNYQPAFDRPNRNTPFARSIYQKASTMNCIYTKQTAKLLDSGRRDGSKTVLAVTSSKQQSSKQSAGLPVLGGDITALQNVARAGTPAGSGERRHHNRYRRLSSQSAGAAGGRGGEVPDSALP